MTEVDAFDEGGLAHFEFSPRRAAKLDPIEALRFET